MCLGIPGRLVDLAQDEGLRMGTVDFDGVRRPVCLDYTPEAAVGDYVIVHVGFAISRVDREEAARTLAVIRAMPEAMATELGPVSEVRVRDSRAEPAPGGADEKPTYNTGTRSSRRLARNDLDPGSHRTRPLKQTLGLEPT
ncbi:HypC/HybG/HupF family hydrogenase formation chaperone [Allokutzneria oryzae]|uniref:HypC/HybG/HupF family hydrogenase formation chaperone n=1 Tax=Allokutzneria oryzae TaxID=1378989 RepID=A0ABV5ZWY4_9PSEU